ncbi:ANKRD50, partial [Symbiodinium pilosum]
MGHEQSQESPKTGSGRLACRKGMLQLSEDYKVEKPLFIEGPCNITGQSILSLEAPISFGDNTRFDGAVTFVASKSLQGPCAFVAGSMAVELNASVTFKNCFNHIGHGSGGGLRVWNNLKVLGGHLAFDACGA